MVSRRKTPFFLVAALTALVPVLVVDPASAGASVEPVPLAPTVGVGAAADRAHPGMIAAMARDLKLTPEQARQRLDREHTGRLIRDRVRVIAGARFAGSWVDEDASTLTVAVTHRRLLPAVRAAGATPKLVRYSLAELRGGMDRLDARTHPGGVGGWHVDPARNRLVVSARPGAQAAARAFVASAEVPAAMVAYETWTTPTMTADTDVFAGDSVFGPGGECTIGFGVRPIEPRQPPSGITGFLTTGHCYPERARVSSVLRQPFGTVTRSTFGTTGPGPDQAYVLLDRPAFTAREIVDGYGAGLITVRGSAEADPGDSVCKAGAASQWRCGKVRFYDTSRPVTFVDGGDRTTRMVTNVTETSICANPGDSGAPVLFGEQAQGIHVGSQGPCADFPDGKSLFQRLRPILRDYRMILLTPRQTTPEPLRVGNLLCERLPLGNAHVECRAEWTGGVDLADAKWYATGYGAPREPIVETDALAHLTFAVFDCDANNPDTEYTYSAQVIVTDAIGRRAGSNLTIPCGW